MGKNSNRFSFKNEKRDIETVIEISELQNKTMTIDDVSNALSDLLVSMQQIALDSVDGYKTVFETPIEK